MLEIFNYGKDPIRQLFNKGNPVWQALFIQAAEGTPTLDGIPFKAEPTFVREEAKPWEGKKGWDTLKPRLKHLCKTSLPYSIQGFDEKGVIPGITQFLVTRLGALPVRKGMSLTSSLKLRKVKDEKYIQ